MKTLHITAQLAAVSANICKESEAYIDKKLLERGNCDTLSCVLEGLEMYKRDYGNFRSKISDERISTRRENVKTIARSFEVDSEAFNKALKEHFLGNGICLETREYDTVDEGIFPGKPSTDGSEIDLVLKISEKAKKF